MVDLESPAFKRAKMVEAEASSLSKTASIKRQPKEKEANATKMQSITNGHARPLLEAASTTATAAAKYKPSRDEEMIRMIMQYLNDHGYAEASQKLEQSSGLIMEPSATRSLRMAVLDAEWKQVDVLLLELQLGKTEMKQVRHLIRQQKYLELIEKSDFKGAVQTLRSDITVCHDETPETVQQLSSILISKPEALQARLFELKMDYGREKLLSKIQSFLPPHTMLPPRRLESLIDQAMSYQKANCLYHCKTEMNWTLLRDHACSKNEFPFHCKRICTSHTDEIWYIQFSPDGKYLASASKDKTAIVWDAEAWKPVYFLAGHTDSVTFLVWSPNGEYLATCGNDSKINIWLTKTGELLKTLDKHTDIVTACAWFPDSQRLVSGSIDQCLMIWDLSGQLIHKWTGHRVTDLCISSLGNLLYAVCQERKIRTFGLEAGHYREVSCITMLDSITSLTLAKDERYALVSLASQELHIWDLAKKKLHQKYQGHKQSKYVVRSCFGGQDQNFVISGSEDDHIYIWHRRTCSLFMKLSGHTAVVNSVSWRPGNGAPCFASASDDGTLRVWEAEDNH